MLLKNVILSVLLVLSVGLTGCSTVKDFMSWRDARLRPIILGEDEIVSVPEGTRIGDFKTKVHRWCLTDYYMDEILKVKEDEIR